MARRGRSREFRELFGLPEDETLVDGICYFSLLFFLKFSCFSCSRVDNHVVDYSCALSRTILLQGRMYVSRNYICFYARVIKETKVIKRSHLNGLIIRCLSLLQM